jgi:two-component sensor histidine kinase
MPQFIRNGPDIPERLLQEHEDGRVVFFCGAGVSYPASLPGFGGLARMETTSRPDNDMHMELYCCSSHGGILSDQYLLVRELSHRFDSQLESTIHLAGLIAAETLSEEVRDALATVIQYVHESAQVHRALRIPAGDGLMDAAPHIRAVCQAISRADLQYRNIELLLREIPLQLPASHCWRIGMIVAEFLANASRRAIGGSSGTIQVELRERGSLVECSVADNGSAPRPVRSGQGLSMIDLLALEIKGEVIHRFEAGGTIATLSFPRAEIGLPTHGSFIQNRSR